jgi:hypothetical protein
MRTGEAEEAARKGAATLIVGIIVTECATVVDR